MLSQPKRRHDDSNDEDDRINTLQSCLEARERTRLRRIKRLRRLDAEIEALELSIHRFGSHGFERQPTPPSSPMQQRQLQLARTSSPPEFIETFGDCDNDSD
ncbi:hypothetical protein PF005_g17935 [Phytophthora fragariae]|uniref:Uncharacterized protein n=1 Tax=Phytophthora fragariae TaxID=53985 RepID=A0A6A3X8H7_9STRA|nr:hypothetical protein PF003_g9693 [Phytophthora fragariae]KAE8931355.1 hypothetical protein PF009_g18578 [Phytophthora fragariae]KAE8996287.1 hypothetical protein PF011_g15966 [Phytophthora fragariae]KAE9087622.1 hypothetical protein PF007_g20297 [Phytophthora fragariae]KAE9094939.1 hypothetical protein PF010_g16899 [Phytophthora fragariae]